VLLGREIHSLSIIHIEIAPDHNTVPSWQDVLLALATANGGVRTAIGSVRFGPNDWTKLHAAAIIGLFRHAAAGAEAAVGFALAGLAEGADGAEQLDEEWS